MLNLYGLDCSTIIDLLYTFNGYSSLKTIYVNKVFVSLRLSSSSFFYNCMELVSNNSIAYNNVHSATYFHVDTFEHQGI